MTSFMDLPPELRNNVYRYVQPRIGVDIADKRKNHPTLLSITPLIDEEYRRYFYGNTIFMLAGFSSTNIKPEHMMIRLERMKATWARWVNTLSDSNANMVSHMILFLDGASIKIDIRENGRAKVAIRWRGALEKSRAERIEETLKAKVDNLNNMEQRVITGWKKWKLESLMDAIWREMENRDDNVCKDLLKILRAYSGPET